MNTMTSRMSVLLTLALAACTGLHVTALASTHDPAHIAGIYSDIRFEGCLEMAQGTGGTHAG